MLRHSFRDARRLLTRDPGLTLVVLLTLTLGIGANTIVFSLLHGVLLSPLPYPEPDRLIRVFESNPEFPMFPVSPANFLDYQRETNVFTSLAVFTREDVQLSGESVATSNSSGGASSSSSSSSSGGSSSSSSSSGSSGSGGGSNSDANGSAIDTGRSQRLAALGVTRDYFDVLGVAPALGRIFDETEMLSGHGQVLVISDRIWRRRFGSDPTAIGRPIRVNGQTWTIVGVLPSGFQHVGGSYRSLPHGETVDAWWPLSLTPGKVPRGAHFLNAVGRLKPGITPADASADLNRVAKLLAERYPRSNTGWQIRVMPLRDEIVGTANTLLLMLMTAAGAVLLIGCANVASLLLARAIVRRREMAIRLALGAAARRLIGQVLAESLVLAILGGLLGFLVAIAGTRALTAVMPADFPRLHMIHVDWRVLGFTAGLACATALIFGLVPALHSASPDVQGLMRDGGRSVSAGRKTLLLRHGLVVAEIALASALLVAAGLLARSFVTLMRTEPGFHTERVLTFSISLPRATYPEPRDVVGFVARLRENLAALPGVQSVGAANALPWSGWDENTSFEIVQDRQKRGESDEGPHGRYNIATPGYFETLGIPLVRGRFPDARDAFDAPKTVVINEALARTYFPGEDPLYRTLNMWGHPRQIVGIVGNVKDQPAAVAAAPAFYWPQAQEPRQGAFPVLTFALKTAGEPLSLVAAARAAVTALDRELPIADVRTLDDVSAAAHAERRFLLAVVSLFGGLALVLSAIGAYGVMSYSAAQRHREFGVRLALGAARGQIVRLVLTQGIRLTLAGLLLGLGLALILGRLMRGLLYGISATDAETFLAAALVITTIALAASLLPAVRAARADPMRALRME